jgi:beta-lactamase regulating signal transducer with metallopeptidase domain
MNTSDSLINTIALSLLHFLWQGAAIAASAGTLMLVLRRPATRYLVSVGALVLMLISFVTTVALLSSGDSATELLSARAPAAALASPKVATVTSLEMLWTSQAVTTSDAFVWMARAWFAGVFVFALRIVFGLLVIGRLRRRSLVALPPRHVARFEALQERLRLDRFIRYCECEGVSVPAVIGVFRPIVLLPLRALTGLSAEQLDAVVAHELGHILRFDVAVNFLQVIAETLLFFHPAVWWLNKRIRADREDCCDDIAVSACGSRVAYARALAAMEGWRETPNFAMAATGGTVAARVARLLGVRGERGERASRAIAALLMLTMALAAGVASLGVALPAAAQSSVPAAPPVAPEPVVPATEVVPPVPPVPAPKMLPPVPTVPEAPAANLEVAPPAPPIPAVPAPQPAREVEPLREPKAAKDPKAAKEPKVAKLHKAPKEPKAAKEAKVSKEPKVAKEPKQPRAAKEPKVDRDERVDVRQIEQVDVQQDVQGEVREEVRSNLNHHSNQNHHQNSNNHALRPTTRNSNSSVEDREALGVSKEDFAALQAMNISPDYVRAMRSTSPRPSTADIIAMKAMGVTPDYLEALRAVGIQTGAAGVMQVRTMGITPEDIEHAMKLGFNDLTVDKLIQLDLSSVL